MAGPWEMFAPAADAGPWTQFAPVEQSPEEPQSFFRQVADVPLGVAKGAVQGVRMIADAFGAGSETSKVIKGAENYLGGLMSAAAKKDQAEISRLMKDAEDKGVLEQVKAGFQAFATAPVDMLSQAFGTAVPVILATVGSSLLGGGAGVATGVSALTGAGMGAGVVKGSIYDATKQALIEAGAQPEEAEKRAQLAQEYGGKNLDQILLGTVLGGVAAVGPLEKGAAGALARRILGKVSGEEVAETTAEQAAKGALRRRAEAAGLEAVPEAVQAGQEQAAQNIALQREGFEVPTMRGVAGAATLEGLAGAGLGALAGGRRPTPPVEPEVEPPAPEAPPAPPVEPPRALEFKPEPYIQFPDGTVAKQSEVEAYIKTLPEDQQMAMRTKLLGLAPQEADKEPAPPTKALEFKPEPLIVYPDGSVAKRSEVDAYIQGLPEDEQIPARAKLFGMGEEATQVTPEMLRKLGIRGRAPIIQRLSGLELTDPKVQEELTSFAQQSFASPEVRGNIFGFLNTIKVEPAARTVAEATPLVSEAPPAPPVASPPVESPTLSVELAAPVVEAAAPPAQPVAPTKAEPTPPSPVEPSAGKVLPLTPALQGLGKGQLELYNFADAIEQAKKPITGYDYETVVDRKEIDDRVSTPESLMRDLTGNRNSLKNIDGKIRSGNRTSATYRTLIDAWVTTSQVQNRIDQSKRENPELWKAYEERQRKLQDLEVGDEVETFDGERAVIDAKFGQNWRIAFPKGGRGRLEGEKTLVPPSALRPVEEAKPKAEATAAEAPAAPAKLAKAAKPRKAPGSIMGSPMLAGIFNQLGGLHTSLLSEFSTRFFTKSLDKNGRPIIRFRNPLVSGRGSLFNKNGKVDFTEIAEHLEQEGYLEPGSVERDYKEAGERAKDLIKRALNKEEVLTIQEQIEKDSREAQEAARQAQLEREEENRMIAAGEMELEPEFDWTDDEFRENLGFDKQFEEDLDVYNLEPEDLRFLTDEELESELTDAEREQAQARRTRKAEEDARRKAAEGPAPGEDETFLTAQSEEELRERDKAIRQKEYEEKLKEAKARTAERKEREQRDVKARALETVDDFELGRTAEEQMSGMRDMFEEPAKPRKYEFLTTSEPAIDSDRIPSYKRGVETLRKKLDRGEITTDEFANRVDFLAKQVEKARLAKDIPARERGADYIRQRLLEAKRRGDLSAETVDFAEWFIQNNPKLVDDLAISIRAPKGDSTAGVYNKLARIAVLMKDSSKDTTAVHEILHHLERMMPKEIQSAIRKSWAKSLAEAQKKATTESDKQFFQHVLDYHQSGKQSDLNKAKKLIQDGKVDYTNYQYTSPSEFWAVNGTDIMQGRFDVKGSLLGRLKQWLSELTEKAKDLFGLDNKAAIIRALDSLSKGDGKFVTTEMLDEFAVEPKDIRAKAAKAKEDIITAGRAAAQKRAKVQGGRLGEELNTAINKVFVPENETYVEKIERWKDRTWQRIAQGVADQFRTIKDYSEKGYMIATTSKSIDGAMETLMRYGEVYNDGGALNVRKDTKGLIEALTPLGKEVDTFFVWMALNREANQPANKKSEFIDPDTGEDLLAKLVAKRNELNQGKMKDPKTGFMVDRAVVYERARKDMMKLNRSVLDIAHGKVTRKPGEKEPLLNAAIIDDEAFDKFINDAFFVPFYREMEGKGVEHVRTASGLTGQQFSKALKGSALPFADLYNNVLLNWSHILSASMKNAAAVQTIEDALTYGGIEAVVPNLKSQYEWKNNKVYKVGTDELVGDGSLQWNQTTDEGNGVSMVMIDGNKTYFKVTDPLLFEAISAIGYLGKSSKFLDMATKMSQWLRFGVTVSPVFRINNLLRDPVAAAAVAGGKLKFTPLDFVQNTIEGIRLYDPKNESYLGALAGGGIFNMGYRFEGDQSKLIKKLQAAGIDNESILDSDKKIRTALKTLWNKYEEYGNKAESAQRLKLYKTMREKDMSHLEAVFYARDLMDYSKQGAWPAIRILMQTVPFLNARTQGLYKLGRDGIIPTVRTLYNVVNGKSYDQLTEEEKKQRITDTQKAKAFSAVAGAAVAASLLLYFMYKDDEDFKKRDAWDRDNFFWFKVPGTSLTRSVNGEEVKTEVAIRIPKPFEIGALATIVERITEQIVDENAEGKQFGDALSRMLVNTFAFDLPQFIRPAVDLYANKDNFTKAPIEGPGMERLSKAERMTPDTSPLAVMISRAANILLPEKAEVSPLQMDYAMQAYFGWLGATVGIVSQYAVMPFKDGAYPDARWMDRASLGLVKELPGRSGGYVTSFYDNAKAINQAMADMRHYAAMGEMEKALEIQQDKMDKIQLYGVYQRVGDIMGNIRRQINLIKVDKTMSGAEKKQAIENMQQLMNEYAKMAEDIRKQQKLAK